jgi:hypothetical protein
MNTRDDWTTTARIYDEPRRALWMQIFPDAVIPIRSILTQRVRVPERGEVDAYMLDLDAISDDQREGVIRLISRRFEIPIEEVRAEIDLGVPIIAEGVSVSTRDQGILFSMEED